MSDPVLGSAAFCCSLPIAVRSRRIAQGLSQTYLLWCRGSRNSRFKAFDLKNRDYFSGL
ncbi:hypothetical protein FIBSPDRAFT_859571 [Athelia psychrophila]|uniref:Uncharacterized protein n=1 Tax=Athelia psychrophila TaxID=1759441 RepID=A0A166KV03_9AGAM|nr:hypothetical protein FIBSPDRAFT_859571 [Fibularhizoctonia sp. CBS 109695]